RDPEVHRILNELAIHFEGYSRNGIDVWPYSLGEEVFQGLARRRLEARIRARIIILVGNWRDQKRFAHWYRAIDFGIESSQDEPSRQRQEKSKNQCRGRRSVG